jgi:hypothetical protein
MVWRRLNQADGFVHVFLQATIERVLEQARNRERTIHDSSHVRLDAVAREHVGSKDQQTRDRSKEESMGPPMIMQFGSRAGTCLALVLFCAVFAVLSIAAVRGVARGTGLRRRTQWLIWSIVFGVLTATLYYSSLSGFYEASLVDDRLVLSYLHPMTVELQLDAISGVRTAPAFKGAWCLYIADAQGVEYISATARRDVVEAAAATLRRHCRRCR